MTEQRAVLDFEINAENVELNGMTKDTQTMQDLEGTDHTNKFEQNSTFDPLLNDDHGRSFMRKTSTTAHTPDHVNSYPPHTPEHVINHPPHTPDLVISHPPELAEVVSPARRREEVVFEMEITLTKEEGGKGHNHTDTETNRSDILKCDDDVVVDDVVAKDMARRMAVHGEVVKMGGVFSLNEHLKALRSVEFDD